MFRCYVVFLLCSLTCHVQAATPETVPVSYVYNINPHGLYQSFSCDGVAENFVHYARLNSDLTRVEITGPTACDPDNFWTYTTTNIDSQQSITYTKQTGRVASCPAGYKVIAQGNVNTCVKSGQYDNECDGSLMCCATRTGYPIDVVTGNKYLEAIDYRSSGVYPLQVKRYFNSNTDPKWRFDYTQRIEVTQENTDGHPYSVAAIRPNGSVYEFYAAMVPVDLGNVTQWRTRNPAQQQMMKISPVYVSFSKLAPPRLEGWVLNISGDKEFYDVLGRLESIEYEDGNVVYIQNYSDSIIISNIQGESVTLNIEESLQTPLGTIGYDFDDDRLLYVHYPDGTSTRYHYESPIYQSFVTGITDRRGVRYSTYQYSSSSPRAIASYKTGNVDKVTVPGGSSSSYIPSSKSFSNSKGDRTTMQFDVVDGVAVLSGITDCRGCGYKDASFEYSVEGNIEQYTMDGVTTSLDEFDPRGNPQVITEASGTSVERVLDLDYHPSLFNDIETIQQDSVFSGAKQTEHYQKDEYGNVESLTVMGYDPDGHPVSRWHQMKYEGPLNQISEYDGPHSINQNIDDRYLFDYYPDSYIEGNNRARLRSITAPAGIVVVNDIEYTATGKRSSYRSANGLMTVMDYYPGNDRLSRLTVTDNDLGTVRKTCWDYLATGEVKQVRRGCESVDETEIAFEYDDARRLLRVLDGAGNYIRFTLDTEGNLNKEEIYDTGDVLRKQLTQVFDDYNRLDLGYQENEILDIKIKPNGDVEEVIDGKYQVSRFFYDELRRLTGINRDVGGTEAETADALIQLDYDVQGNLKQVVDPVGGTTEYDYDDLGNLLRIISPDTGETSSTYDAAGNIDIRTDAKGQVFDHDYDALNRIKRLDMPGIDHDISYSYDNCQKGKGRICSIANAAAKLHYAYDAEGNVLSHQSIKYEYDAVGRLSSIRYPSGALTQYIYGPSGRIEQVSLTRAGVTTILAAGIQYDPFGPVSSMIYGNGLPYNQQNDTAYRVAGIHAGSALDLDYQQYDENGNLERREDNLLSALEEYTYDALDRIKQASGLFGALSYGYDKNGNRTRYDDSTVTTYGYAAASNRMSSQAGLTVSLDANGNTETRGMQTLAYTPHNRLEAVVINSETLVFYRYNGLGQRVEKSHMGGSGRHFIYGLDGKLLAETDIYGNILHEYIFLEDKLLARYDVDTDQDGISNIRESQAGTNPAMPDDDGDGLTNLQELFEYGTSPNAADSDGDGVSDLDEITSGEDPLAHSAPLYQLGDLNQDGMVGTSDLLLLQRLILNLYQPDSHQAYLADINQDSVIDAGDLVLLTKQVLATAANDSEYLRNSAIRFAEWLLEQIPVAQASVDGSEIYYIHNDHLGTPKSLSDESGEMVWYAMHMPFGQAIVESDPDDDGYSVEFNIRYPGQYFDAESGLHYNYFRTYDPKTGRYTSSDPIGLVGGSNTFEYARSNSLLNVDPFGLEVLLQTHPVAFGFVHAKLTIIPENQERWGHNTHFTNVLDDGRSYITIGAGPEGIFDLVSNINRPLDVNMSQNLTSQQCLDINTRSEDVLIEDLLRADARYPDNLPYNFFPRQGANVYNSNSYIRGLMDAVGITANNPVNAPGISVPVPLEYFKRR